MLRARQHIFLQMRTRMCKYQNAYAQYYVDWYVERAHCGGFFFRFFFVDASLARPKKLKIIYQSWQMNLFKFQVTYVREREKGFFGHQKTMRCAHTEYLSFKVGIQLMCINSHMCGSIYVYVWRNKAEHNIESGLAHIFIRPRRALSDRNHFILCERQM